MTVRILVGDWVEQMRTLPDASVQMVGPTSPPYLQLRSYLPADHPDKVNEIGNEATPEEFVAALVEGFREARRILRPDGVCVINLGDSYAGSGKGPTGHNGVQKAEIRQGNLSRWKDGTHTPSNRDGLGGVSGFKPKDLLLVPQRFAIGMQDRGWWVRSEIVWAKTSGMPESVKDRPTSAWEPIWMFAKSRQYFYDAGAVRQPHKPESIGHRERYPMAQYASKQALAAGHTKSVDLHPLGANLRNVWTLGPEPFTGEHYAAYPTEIPRRCILAGSRKGDLVLDPFLGSGTTALVADRLGRDCIGIELNPEYAAMAKRRIEADAGPLLADPVAVEAPARQVSLFAEVAG